MGFKPATEMVGIQNITEDHGIEGEHPEHHKRLWYQSSRPTKLCRGFIQRNQWPMKDTLTGD